MWIVAFGWGISAGRAEDVGSDSAGEIRWRSRSAPEAADAFDEDATSLAESQSRPDDATARETPEEAPAERARLVEEIEALAGADGPGMRSAGGRRHIVVQFDSPVDAARRAGLESSGLRLLSYLGEHAYFASLAPVGLEPPTIAASGRLREVHAIRRVWKLHPALVGKGVPAWSVVPVGGSGAITPSPQSGDAGSNETVGETWVAVYVLFHPDVGLETEGVAVCGRHGAVVRDVLRTVNGLVIELPRGAVDGLAEEDAVQWVEPPLPRMNELNDSNRALVGANVVQAAPYGLDGSGVTVLVYDGATALAEHPDFGGRLHVRDASGLHDHPTHVAGTIGGDGSVSGGRYRGMAPGVTLESYGLETDGSGIFLYTNPGDIERDYDEAINVYGADIANSSIGTNICANFLACAITGDYGVTSAVIDSIVRGGLGQPFRSVWANGNERACDFCCGTTPGGYRSTPPPATAKNHIAVGAVNSNDDSMTSFSSWGPTDDGRLKPDVVAPGCQTDGDEGVTSCGTNGAYIRACGTSMAAPTVTGLGALLLQDYRAHFPEREDFRNSTLKALLAHNAVDRAPPGPDFQTGYGSVRIQPTIDFMRSDAFLEDQVDEGSSFSLSLTVIGGDNILKVTLAWDDAPGTPNVDPSLVNDLDLRVFDPQSTQHYPWTLDPLIPEAPAVRRRADHVNNIEQVFVANPMLGVWRIEVRGLRVPVAPQPFSICFSPSPQRDCDDDGVPDGEQLAADPSLDCSGNGVLDACEPDCNATDAADSCDILTGVSVDCDGNGIPDECQAFRDCNANSVVDACDIRDGPSADCNGNGIPDECVTDESDCNTNLVPDECDLFEGASQDCNANDIPDECDIVAGLSSDCQGNAVPDECELRVADCNGNGIVDDCDITASTSGDGDGDGVPDECQALVLFVDASASGKGQGTGWADAYTDLQTALTVAAHAGTARAVWVAKGTYRPSLESIPGDPRSATFAVSEGLSVLGGFIGDESVRDERDPTHNVTVLSGDLLGDDTPAWDNRVDNAYRVVTAVRVTGATVVDGFTITSGTTSDESITCRQFAGGGMYIEDASPTVSNCRFLANDGQFGGAVYVEVGSPEFSDCLFEGNRADVGSAFGTGNLRSLSLLGSETFGRRDVFERGGGPFFDDGGDPTLRGCSFIDNVSFTSGGAVWIQGGAPRLVDCLFVGNRATTGGAVRAEGADATFVNCEFYGNRSSRKGGAIHIQYESVVAIVNSVFSANEGGADGGAITSDGLGVELAVYNSTLAGNRTTGRGGGIFADAAATTFLVNSILWDNEDNQGGGEGSQFFLSAGPRKVDYSCIEGWSGNWGGTGNIGEDPLFANPPGGDELLGTADDNLRLLPSSPCVDAGSNDDLPSDVTDVDADADVDESLPIDCDGNARRFDVLEAEDTGLGAPPVVDMGAFESGDCNGNGVRDEVDLLTGYSADCNGNLSADECDILFRSSVDCDENVIPDECEADCDSDGVPDECEIAFGIVPDRNQNGVPDYCESAIVYVDAAATGLASGTTWQDAYTDLNDALGHARQAGGLVDTIWVAAGVYRPGNSPAQSVSFTLVDGVSVYGGFAGGEAFLEERDAGQNLTVLSGDLQGNDGPDFANYEDNAFHVVSLAGPAATEIDGFTIGGGNAPLEGGGGIRITGGSLRISHCRIAANRAVFGSGMFIENAVLTLSDSILVDNLAETRGAAVFAGRSELEIARCTFGANGAGIAGAAVYHHGPGALRLRDSLFTENESASGGALWATGVTGTVSYCRVLGNSGAGIFVDGSDLAIVNSVFSGNTADYGGAVRVTGEAEVELVNCSLAANSATFSGGAVYAEAPSLVRVVNSILWDNAVVGLFDERSQISGSLASLNMRNSCLMSWTGIIPGFAIVSNNPRLLNVTGRDGVAGTIDDDLRIGAGSSCIDAGDNTALTAGTAEDLAGEQRFVDDPVAVDTGQGEAPIIDLGAFEYQLDCDGNGKVDSVDIGQNQLSDCNRNGVLDVCDIREFRVADGNANGVPDVCETAVVYVNAMAGGLDTGLTWADAYNGLSEALNHAEQSSGAVREIWVAAGVYAPASPGGDRNSSFCLLEGVSLRGGFAGGESAAVERIAGANETILSGDLNGDDDGGSARTADNAFHVLSLAGDGEATEVEGFSIVAGVADGAYPRDRGGGLWSVRGRAVFRDCRFLDHRASVGGATYCEGSNTVFLDCLFANNWAESKGGALYNSAQADSRFENCAFRSNFASEGGGMFNTGAGVFVLDSRFEENVATLHGGAVANLDGAVATFERCRFDANRQSVVSAAGSGGAIYNKGSQVSVEGGIFALNESGGNGGALVSANSPSGTLLAGCLFEDNEAATGGAIFGASSVNFVVERSIFRRNVARSDGGGMAFQGSVGSVIGCLVAGNVAVDDGGGLYLANSVLSLEGVTLVDNMAAGPGAAVHDISGSQVSMRNTIEWDNKPRGITAESFSGSVSFSDIESGWVGPGNLSADPMFVDASAGDYSLAAGSPCIDAGDREGGPLPGAQDVLGEPRVQQCRVDMGAIESSYFADCDSNGASDSCDIIGGSVSDCNDDGIPDGCESDCNNSGKPDDCDVLSGYSDDCNGNIIPDECEIDCNGNTVPDDCDLLMGTSADCNGNRQADECDIADGLSADCNGNVVPDDCDLGRFEKPLAQRSPIGSGRSQAYLLGRVPEALGEVSVVIEASADLNDAGEWLDVKLNGEPLGRVFETGGVDCAVEVSSAELVVGAESWNGANVSGDGVLSIVASSQVSASACGGASFVRGMVRYRRAAMSLDCNGNEVPDECEVMGGGDCNVNGVPDECDIVGVVSVVSPRLSPIGIALTHRFEWSGAPRALGDVTLAFTASANLADSTEWITVDLDGRPLGRVFVTGAGDCPVEPDRAELLVPAEVFNETVDADGVATISVMTSASVSPFACAGASYVIVSVEYIAAVNDCNNNAEPDDCEVARGDATDVNFNGRLDGCESLGDFDGNGQVDLFDFERFVNCASGLDGGPVAEECAVFDIEGDGDVDVRDFRGFQIL